MLNLESLILEPVANIVKKYIGNRKLVLLGDSKPFRQLLSIQYNLDVAFVAVLQSKALSDSGKDERLLKDFEGKSDEFYICIPCHPYNKQVQERLERYGYVMYQDFAYANHQRIEVPPNTKGYEDEYGNVVHSSGSFTIIFSKYAGNSYVDIADSVKAGTQSAISFLANGAELRIEENCRFSHNSSFELHALSKLHIHKGCSFGYMLRIWTSNGSFIEIGEDCMFSGEVKLYVADGHSIFDTETGKRINKCYPHNSKNEIRLDAHVWVGLHSMILASRIGRSSIVGAGSVVKGSYPNNCIIAGNPAVIRKQNVTWARDDTTLEIEKCGIENIALTIQDKVSKIRRNQ